MVRRSSAKGFISDRSLMKVRKNNRLLFRALNCISFLRRTTEKATSTSCGVLLLEQSLSRYVRACPQNQIKQRIADSHVKMSAQINLFF